MDISLNDTLYGADKSPDTSIPLYTLDSSQSQSLKIGPQYNFFDKIPQQAYRSRPE